MEAISNEKAASEFTERHMAIGRAVISRKEVRIRMDVLREQIEAEDARILGLRQEFYRLKNKGEELTAELKALGIED